MAELVIDLDDDASRAYQLIVDETEDQAPQTRGEVASSSSPSKDRPSAPAAVPAEEDEVAMIGEGDEQQGVRPPACKRPRRASIIPCDVCGLAVPFEEFEAHAETHVAELSLSQSSSASPKGSQGYSTVLCPECGCQVPSEEAEDHARAHRFERREKLRAKRREEQDVGDGTPDALAFRVVQLLRERGSGLPGNRHPPQPVRSPELALLAPPFLQEISSGSQTREVVNFDTCARFVRRMMALKADSRTGVSFKPEVVYHWTPAKNHHSIIEDSLLVPGEQLTHSSGEVQVINGQALGKGIYTSTDPSFGAAYGSGARGAFLCLALPGLQVDWAASALAKHQAALAMRRRRAPSRRALPVNSSPDAGDAYDSLRQGTVRVYTASDLVLPCFIAEVSAAPELCKILQEVSDLLLAKIAPSSSGSSSSSGGPFNVGDHVKALWSLTGHGDGRWYAAMVKAVNADGTYAISWASPYTAWPGEKKKPLNELQRASPSASGGA